jgi:hypothetical protein
MELFPTTFFLHENNDEMFFCLPPDSVLTVQGQRRL